MSKDECYRPFEYLGDGMDCWMYKCKSCGKKFNVNAGLFDVEPVENTVVEDGRRMLKCPGCGVT